MLIKYKGKLFKEVGLRHSFVDALPQSFQNTHNPLSEQDKADVIEFAKKEIEIMCEHAEFIIKEVCAGFKNKDFDTDALSIAIKDALNADFVPNAGITEALSSLR